MALVIVGCVGALLAFPLLLTWELALSLTSSSTLGVIHWPWQEAGRKDGREEGLGEIGSVTEIAGTLALVWNSKPPAWFVAPCFKNRLGF